MGLLHRPVGNLGFFFDGGPVRGVKTQFPVMGHHHFFLLQQVILPGVFYNGRYIGGHIATGLILAAISGLPGGCRKRYPVPFQQHTEAVSSLHLRRSGMDGCHRALVQLHMVVQQGRRYFGIGLGQEVISFTLQPLRSAR